MEELCSLLKTKQQRNIATSPIEPANEAHEANDNAAAQPPIFVLNKTLTKADSSDTNEASNSESYVIPDEKLNTSLEKIFLNSKEIEMYEFIHDVVTDAVSDS
jgi:hypothetical protein